MPYYCHEKKNSEKKKEGRKRIIRKNIVPL
jgi:hypothetical protein